MSMDWLVCLSACPHCHVSQAGDHAKNLPLWTKPTPSPLPTTGPPCPSSSYPPQLSSKRVYFAVMVALLILLLRWLVDDGQLLVRASPSPLKPNFLKASISYAGDEVVYLFWPFCLDSPCIAISLITYCPWSNYVENLPMRVIWLMGSKCDWIIMLMHVLGEHLLLLEFLVCNLLWNKKGDSCSSLQYHKTTHFQILFSSFFSSYSIHTWKLLSIPHIITWVLCFDEFSSVDDLWAEKLRAEKWDTLY